MRITTNALLRNYKSNLSASIANLDSTRTKVMTQRKFNSTKEDPSSALRAAVLERKYVRNPGRCRHADQHDLSEPK